MSPEQSYEFGPAAAYTYGLPSCARAKSIAAAAAGPGGGRFGKSSGFPLPLPPPRVASLCAARLFLGAPLRFLLDEHRELAVHLVEDPLLLGVRRLEVGA